MDNDLVVDIERRATPRHRPSPRSPELLAWGLGWFSIGLGIAQLVAPRAIARLIGVPMPPALTRLCGAREIACGVGILVQGEPTPWVQARVAGDALDLAMLTAGMAILPDVSPRRAGVATAVVAGITAVDVYCSQQLAERQNRAFPRHVRATVEIERTPDEVYGFCRNLGNLPRIMPYLDSVQVLDEIHSHWVAKGPAGIRIEWDAEIIDDAPNQRIAWRTVEGSQLYNAGSVELQPARQGATRVSVELLYDIPGGSLGLTIAKLLGRDPEREVHADLQTFKQLLETGDYPANRAA